MQERRSLRDCMPPVFFFYSIWPFFDDSSISRFRIHADAAQPPLAGLNDKILLQISK